MVTPIETEVATGLPDLSACACLEALEAILTAALAVAVVALWTCHSSADSVFFA